jgi:hypothetical protein
MRSDISCAWLGIIPAIPAIPLRCDALAATGASRLQPTVLKSDVNDAFDEEQAVSARVYLIILGLGTVVTLLNAGCIIDNSNAVVYIGKVNAFY